MSENGNHKASFDDAVKDPARIAELARLRLNEDHVDEILNDYVSRAASELGLPISLVSIVLDDVQKFSASVGLTGWLEETQDTPVEWSFCANSVETGQPFVVEDAEKHAKTKDNPLVHHDAIRCYAGVPMVTKNNFVIGNFCVIGTEARTFKEDEINLLREFAKLTVDQLEKVASSKS